MVEPDGVGGNSRYAISDEGHPQASASLPEQPVVQSQPFIGPVGGLAPQLHSFPRTRQIRGYVDYDSGQKKESMER